MPLDAHYLDIFRTILDERSLSRAANRLHTSASNVKRIVSVLEQELGVPLFERTSRGHYDPTSHAERLEQEMAGFLDEMHQLEDFVNGIRDVGRVLRVGAHRWFFETRYFVRLFNGLRSDTRFRSTYVDVEPGSERAMLESGACDLFVGPEVFSSKRLTAVLLPDLGFSRALPLSQDGATAAVRKSGWGLHLPVSQTLADSVIEGMAAICGPGGRTLPTTRFLRWMESPDWENGQAVIAPEPAAASHAVEWRPLEETGIPVKVVFLSLHPYGCLEQVLQRALRSMKERHEPAL